MKFVSGCALAVIKGRGGVREVAPLDTRTLEGIIPADYQQGGGAQVPFQYGKLSDNNIFYSKKSTRNKKKTDMLLLQRFYVYIYIFTFIGGNCPLSRYIVFHIHFPTTSRIMLRF